MVVSITRDMMQQTNEEFIDVELPAVLILGDQSQCSAKLVKLGLEEALVKLEITPQAGLTQGAFVNLSLCLPAIQAGTALSIPAQIQAIDGHCLRISFNIPEQDEIRLLNNWALAHSDNGQNGSSAKFDARRKGQVFNQCKEALFAYLHQHLPGLSDRAREILLARAKEATDDDSQAELFDAMRELEQLSSAVDSEFVIALEQRLRLFQAGELGAETPGSEGADELSLVDTTSFNDWLLAVQIITRVQKKTITVEQQLAVRISLLLNISLEADQLPFGVSHLCSQYHEAIHHLGAALGARQALLAAFEQVLLNDILKLYAHLEEILDSQGIHLPRQGGVRPVKFPPNRVKSTRQPARDDRSPTADHDARPTADRADLPQATTGIAGAVLQLLHASAATTQTHAGPKKDRPEIVQFVDDFIDGLLADPWVGEDAGALIRRLAPDLEQTALDGDLFFADENHPARLLIDALPCLCLNSAPGDQDIIEQALGQALGKKAAVHARYHAAFDTIAPLLTRYERTLSAETEKLIHHYQGQQTALASLHHHTPQLPPQTADNSPQALQSWLARADELMCGDLLLYDAQKNGRGLPASLIWKSMDAQTFVWLLHRGCKPLCLTRQELALALRRGNLQEIEAAGEGLCERVLCRRLYRLHDRVQQYAIYDPVTGLVKRRHFEQEIRASLRRAGSSFDPDYLALVQLDSYQNIIRSHGRRAVNKLMDKLAQVLRRQLREAGLACRINEKCFGILINVGDSQAALGYVQRFRRSVEEVRCIFKGTPFSISVSLGLIAIETQVANVAGAIALASQYWRQANEAGGNQVCSPLLSSTSGHCVTTSAGQIQAGDPDVPELMRTNCLALRAQRVQPISKAAGDKPYYEILLGVRGADGRLAPPGDIIVAAEKTGFITELDRWVVRTSLQWMTEVPERLLPVSGYAMNLSGISLCDEALLADVLGYIEAVAVAPDKLIFEVTETAGIKRLSVAQGFARTLRDLGCGLSLDDFGSGHASFSYLKTLPVDKIKIDGMFVKDITSNPDDYAVVRSINDIAHAMHRLTVAEFVEDEECLAVLRRLGVDYAQGYGIEKPVPINEIAVLKSLTPAAA